MSSETQRDDTIELMRQIADQGREIERLRGKLQSIAESKPRWIEGVGSYAGGETWAGFARRLQCEAAEAKEYIRGVERKPGVPSRQQTYEILKARSLQIMNGEVTDDDYF